MVQHAWTLESSLWSEVAFEEKFLKSLQTFFLFSLYFQCKELQLMLLVGLFQLGGVSWCLAPSGMHAKRTEGVHSLPCVLFAGVGGDGQLHMAFPASVANVRGSRVGWDSAARE